MFYSRPKIDPLGWDLIDLPTPDGSRNHSARTSDNRPVDIRFSSGWLTVERGPVDAPDDSPEMEEVLSLPIAPFGIMDIKPQQICDLLGLTVDGERVDTAGVYLGARGFDWSGFTTYWWSTHMMQIRDDARIFVNELLRTFPGSILVQPKWGSGGRLRCRRIQFMMDTDEMVTVGLDPDESRLKELVSGEEVSTEHYESVFSYRVEFDRTDDFYTDPTGSRFIRERGAGDLARNWTTVGHRNYRVRTEFQTANALSQERMQSLLALLDRYFCRGLESVNIETGAVIQPRLEDDTDTLSYSRLLREEWADKLRNKWDAYLFVGVQDRKTPDEPRTFWGARPTGAA